MAIFTIYVGAGQQPLVMNIDVESVKDIEALLGAGRFLLGELIDVPDENGMVRNRSALIPVSRVQMIVESGEW